MEVGLVRGKELPVDGSFVEANAAKESRVPASSWRKLPESTIRCVSMWKNWNSRTRWKNRTRSDHGVFQHAQAIALTTEEVMVRILVVSRAIRKLTTRVVPRLKSTG